MILLIPETKENSIFNFFHIVNFIKKMEKLQWKDCKKHADFIKRFWITREFH